MTFAGLALYEQTCIWLIKTEPINGLLILVVNRYLWH